MPDWKKIKAEYIRGGVSLRRLADKYGVSFSTIRKLSANENWTDLRSKSGAIRDQKIAESIASHEASKVDLLQTAADLLLQKIVEGLEDGTLSATSRGLRDISGALKDIRDIKGYKSDLDMQEQIARIDKLRREASTESKDNTITVKLEGCDDYAD